MTSYTKTMMEALAEVRGIKTEEAELDEGKMKELHGYIQDGKSAKEIAKIMKLDVKTIKALMSGYNEAYELGTDEYREYLERLTPGEMDEASAKADAMRAMRRGKKEVDPADVDTDATDDDIKGASKNIIMQMRKAVSMRGKFPVEFGDKKKIKIPAKVAQAVQDKYNSLRKPADKEKFQAQVAKSYKDMLRVLKAGYMMKAAYEEVELDEMSPKDKILKKTSDHLQALIKGSNLPDDNAAFSAVRDYVEAGNLKTVADIVKKLDTDPKEAIINAIAKGMGKKEAEKLFKVRITRVEEVEIEKEISELDDLIKELDEGIMGNIAKAAGKSVVKGVKAGGKKVGGAVKKKASGSKIGKAVGKVKSGIQKTKAVGGKIKKAAKTGKAYGDEYDPMLEKLEIIETKLNDYYKILEEVELDEAKYDLYHKDFSSAMQHAYKMAKKLHGITVDPKEIDDKVASGPRKPSEGKTNTYRLKGDKGSIQVQVYNKGGSKPFELNFYKEEVELDESVIDKVKEIASKKKAMKIDGVMVDSFTASAISQIYDKVNDANKKKMEKLPITNLANLAFKMMQKNEYVPEEVELDEALPSHLKKFFDKDGNPKSKEGKAAWERLAKMKGFKKYTSKQVKMAIGIAFDKRYVQGNMTGAVNAIEKIAKGLSEIEPVANALRRANENTILGRIDAKLKERKNG